eukprot:784829-Amphidinium_carterae.2
MVRHLYNGRSEAANEYTENHAELEDPALWTCATLVTVLSRIQQVDADDVVTDIVKRAAIASLRGLHPKHCPSNACLCLVVLVMPANKQKRVLQPNPQTESKRAKVPGSAAPCGLCGKTAQDFLARLNAN